MIEWISSWAEQVIVAVIIGTIIEMILPSGNNKKYIKTVVGIYILFTIIAPIVTKITDTDIDDIDYEKYFKESDTYQTMSSSLTTQNDQSIEEIYIQNIKQDMKSKLEEKGYILKNVEIEIDVGEKNYGKITKIIADIYKNEVDEVKEEENKNTNTIAINKIEIGNTVIENNVKEETTKENLNDSDIKEIKTYLSSVYEINKKNIQINNK